uniref:Putative secreted protein n=1 Tax=Amblyomma triste TaxID=251400 RepID=A0A023G1N5_AMBTT
MKIRSWVLLPCLFVAACGAAINTPFDDNNDDDPTSEYRQWGQFPWEQPGNPPPIFPPDDFLMPRIGRREQKKLLEESSIPLRELFKEYVGDETDEYRIWGKFPWERPQNPPPFVPPSDMMALSQIGRWWNQDYLQGKPEKGGARYSAQDDDDEYAAENTRERHASRKDRKFSRVARSVWNGKPWEKPWNPPPFLPDRYPGHA